MLKVINMTKLELHCDLAYLEDALKHVVMQHVEHVIAKTMNPLYSHFKQSRVRCKFVENDKGTYDLHIWSKLCINYDFVSFIREYCGLDKLMNKYYDNVDDYSNANYGFLDDNKEYTKQYIFYNFTEEEIFGLIALLKIGQYSGIEYKEVIHDLVSFSRDYNFNTLFPAIMHWENNLDKYAILRAEPYNITIYTVNRIDALEAWNVLTHICPDSAYHISNSVLEASKGSILWAHEYNWFFNLYLNEKEFLGLCHMLLRSKGIYDEYK